jgi:hypothetical protein
MALTPTSPEDSTDAPPPPPIPPPTAVDPDFRQHYGETVKIILAFFFCLAIFLVLKCTLDLPAAQIAGVDLSHEPFWDRFWFGITNSVALLLSGIIAFGTMIVLYAVITNREEPSIINIEHRYPASSSSDGEVDPAQLKIV